MGIPKFCSGSVSSPKVLAPKHSLPLGYVKGRGLCQAAIPESGQTSLCLPRAMSLESVRIFTTCGPTHCKPTLAWGNSTCYSPANLRSIPFSLSLQSTFLRLGKQVMGEQIKINIMINNVAIHELSRF